MPRFVDCFRHVHSSLRSHTFFHPRGASRLDRVVVSPCASVHDSSCTVECGLPSDHRLVVASLAVAPDSQPPAPGTPRVRLHFMDFPDLAAQFHTWQTTTTAPANFSGLLQWWPAFKRALRPAACRLNRLARFHRLSSSNEATVARAAAMAAQAALEAGDVSAAPQVVAALAAAAAADLRVAGPCARRTRCHVHVVARQFRDTIAPTAGGHLSRETLYAQTQHAR
jgi:hypothetical protein